MESARKILDRYADILIFAFGIFFVVAMFVRVSKIQEQQDEGITGNMNNLTYVETVCDNSVHGTSIVSFLLGDDVVPVMYGGTTYSSSDREVLIEKIEPSSMYIVSRVYDDDMDFPSTLILEKIVEGEDGT